MALTIRLQRRGATHDPRYRVVVCERSARRDGRFVEVLGYYNPKARGQDKECELKMDRLEYWTSVGAKPSETVAALIRGFRNSQSVAKSA